MPEIIKEIARKLRKNMTKSEKVLWENIRRWNLLWKQFQKQKPIYVYTENSWLARYIISDFYCAEQKLIIELDWNIHDLEEVYLLDKFKENLLINKWYKVIRFRNEEVFENLDLVLERIKKELNGFE
jgi:very-short-patch-repair endonuclease